MTAGSGMHFETNKVKNMKREARAKSSCEAEPRARQAKACPLEHIILMRSTRRLTTATPG